MLPLIQYDVVSSSKPTGRPLPTRLKDIIPHCLSSNFKINGYFCLKNLGKVDIAQAVCGECTGDHLPVGLFFRLLNRWEQN